MSELYERLGEEAQKIKNQNNNDGQDYFQQDNEGCVVILKYFENDQYVYI